MVSSMARSRPAEILPASSWPAAGLSHLRERLVLHAGIARAYLTKKAAAGSGVTGNPALVDL